MDLIKYLTENLTDCTIVVRGNLITIKKNNDVYFHDKNTLEYLFLSGQLTIKDILKWNKRHAKYVKLNLPLIIICNKFVDINVQSSLVKYI